MKKKSFAEDFGLPDDAVLSIGGKVIVGPDSFVEPSPCFCGCDELTLLVQGCIDGNIKARIECPKCGARTICYYDTVPEALKAWNDMVSRNEMYGN